MIVKFPRKRSKPRQLRHEVETLRAERDAERAARRALIVDLRETAARLDRAERRISQLNELRQRAQQDQGAEVARLEERLERTVRGCARYRRELDDRERVIGRLTVQLMGAMGYSREELALLGVVPATAGREPGVEVAS
ncbi:hypothetical protein [Streptomyces mobaraensis]|uniref:Uncharacterized protein n=1 Tax=Streptomyces mobaraensis TaxID=35621 RepID=A0A5N5WE29_STRMB|nr:hypothetical protein [Streptomyces mobaraensis]KAB7850190.1 hypothetical protein FRZ00_06220 [Streptomyces mobaraensis]